MNRTINRTLRRMHYAERLMSGVVWVLGQVLDRCPSKPKSF